jgi:hypothetical protein
MAAQWGGLAACGSAGSRSILEAAAIRGSVTGIMGARTMQFATIGHFRPLAGDKFILRRCQAASRIIPAAAV